MQKEDMPLEGFGGWVRARARAERLGRYLKKPKLGSSVFVVFGFRGSLVSSLGEALRVSLVYMSS